MRLKILTVICLFACRSVNSQTIPGSVSFKTPEVSAFNRNVEVPVSMYTGVPNISIPLYEVSIKGVSVPISLNYHAGGIRVDQEATWVGLGWSLDCGGQISRTVRGIPDENFYLSGANNSTSSINYFNQLPPPNTVQNLELRQSYLGQAKSGSKDYMPDEFHYSLPGYSGKFMFSQEKNKFIIFPKEDIEVSYQGAQFSAWNVKLPNGASVDLGDDAYSINQVNGAVGSPKSSWGIKKIKNTSNDSITFEHQAFTYTSLKLSGSNYNFSGSTSSHNTQMDRIDFRDTRIRTITFPQGTVSFVTAERSDMPSSLLSEINVVNRDGRPIKKIRFYYSYFYAASYDAIDILGLSSLNTVLTYAPTPYRFNRLRLDSVSILNNNQPSNKYTYKFTYYEKAQMPSKFSFSEDHWGFYNGIANTGVHSFIPNIMPDKFQGGDRRVKPENSNVFSLKEITYPEGGSTEFIYENNTAGVWTIPKGLLEYYQDDNVITKEAGILISSYSRTTSFPSPDYTSGGVRYFKRQFTVPLNGYAFLDDFNWKCSTNFGISPGEQYMTPFENNAQFLLERLESSGYRMFITEFNTTPSTPNSSGAYERTGINNKKLSLLPGTYELTVALTYPATSTDMLNYTLSCLIRWRELDNTKQMINIGGLRIKDINYYTSAGVTAKKKSYSYINPYANPGIPDFTSGRVVTFPKYFQVRHRVECNPAPSSSCNFTKDVMCFSNPVVPLETTSGAYLGYEYVDEKDIDITNPSNSLKTTYHFSFNLPYFSQFYPYQSLAQYESAEWTRGKLLSKTIYKGQSVINKEENEYYDWSPHLPNGTDEDYVQEINTNLISYGYLNYTQIYANPPADFYDRVVEDRPDNINFANDNECISYKYGAGNHQVSMTISGNKQYLCTPAFNVTLPYFLHYTGFDKPRSKTITTIDDNGNQLVKKEYYYYETTPTHYQLTKTKTLTSEKDTLASVTKYPSDFSASIPYNSMFQRHILNMPVEQLDYRNNTFLQSSKTNFQDWGNNIIAPQTIEGKKTTYPSEILSRFYGYDVNGNIQSLSKESGTKTTYLWGYNHKYPVAEVVGADLTTVSSFVNQAILDNPASDQQLRDELNKVRTGLANRAALVKTYTYIPLTGMTSETNARGETTYYEYDGFQRLKRIRDRNNNVLKEFDYQYQAPSHGHPIWVTTGNTRCKPCAGKSNYTSNILQQEEKDTNPQSDSYNQSRWTDVGASSTCVVVADWQNTGTVQCLTDGSGYRTGIQRIEQKDMNPCSPTYNQLRNQDISNTVACTPNAPNWQNTGTTRCKPCAVNGSYLTDIQQNEQKDNNPNSSTYNQIRWVDAGPGGSCVINADWQNTATAIRCRKDAFNQNTGEQEQEQKDMNPCSLTYNTLRWVVIGVNRTACPSFGCNPSRCTGNDQKCLNNLCEIGQKVYTSSTYNQSTLQYECTFHYEWSDGSWSQNFVESQAHPCPI